MPPPLASRAAQPLREIWHSKLLKFAARPTRSVPHPSSLPPVFAHSATPLHQASFLETVLAGVFKAAKGGYRGGQYRGGEQARLQAKVPLHRIAPASRSQAAQRRVTSSPFLTARPSIKPSFASPARGLNSARQFSSSQPYLANVVNNVPLGLRALVDQGGAFDERKWKAVKRELRISHAAKKSRATKGKWIAFDEKRVEVQQEFGLYFGAQQEKIFDIVTVSEAPKPTVLLFFPLEPELAHQLLSPSLTLTSHARLLTLAVKVDLAAISRVYADHGHRIAALSNRLAVAGAFDDPSTTATLDVFDNGEKEVRVLFYGAWRIGDVRQALGVYRTEEKEWYRVEDLTAAEESEMKTSAEEHDDLIASLRLPSASHAVSLPEEDDAVYSPLSSPVSSVWIEDIASRTSFEYDYEMDDPHPWDSDGASSRSSLLNFIGEIEDAQRGRLLSLESL